jgi:hypothetical protein
MSLLVDTPNPVFGKRRRSFDGLAQSALGRKVFLIFLPSHVPCGCIGVVFNTIGACVVDAIVGLVAVSPGAVLVLVVVEVPVLVEFSSEL